MEWTGNRGTGTRRYGGYARDHVVRSSGKPDLAGSSAPEFRGDGARWNPEELLVAALSQCHMLWYLHLCADGGVEVTGYMDEPEGTMEEAADGSGRFLEVVLRPRVTVAEAAMMELANAAHADAHRMCFIAGSVNFPVRHEPTVSASSSIPARSGR
ncbi:MAG TPA: OsmC family protein [Gaiellales bacterium]|nr:OsmC family protein [Gaiellales bacterium]